MNFGKSIFDVCTTRGAKKMEREKEKFFAISNQGIFCKKISRARFHSENVVLVCPPAQENFVAQRSVQRSVEPKSRAKNLNLTVVF